MTGLINPVHLDAEAAVAWGYRGIVAPPMFVVVCGRGDGSVLFDPDVEMNSAAMVHGGQESEWGNW